MPPVPMFINHLVGWATAATAITIVLWQIVKLIVTITKFTQTVEQLTTSVQDLTDRSSKDHREIFERLRKSESSLTDHDIRLRNAEHDIKDLKHRKD